MPESKSKPRANSQGSNGDPNTPGRDTRSPISEDPKYVEGSREIEGPLESLSSERQAVIKATGQALKEFPGEAGGTRKRRRHKKAVKKTKKAKKHSRRRKL